MKAVWITLSDIAAPRRRLSRSNQRGPSVCDRRWCPGVIEAIWIARKQGVSAYVGDGLNRWPAVHRLDPAHLFRLAQENGSAGVRYHGVADEGVPGREIAEIIGRRLKLPVISKSAEETAEHFGFLGHFLSIDIPALCSKLFCLRSMKKSPDCCKRRAILRASGSQAKRKPRRLAKSAPIGSRSNKRRARKKLSAMAREKIPQAQIKR
jgi:hypothetical protein